MSETFYLIRKVNFAAYIFLLWIVEFVSHLISMVRANVINTQTEGRFELLKFQNVSPWLIRMFFGRLKPFILHSHSRLIMRFIFVSPLFICKISDSSFPLKEILYCTLYLINPYGNLAAQPNWVTVYIFFEQIRCQIKIPSAYFTIFKN